MYQFHVGTLRGANALPPDLLEGMFRMRYEVFHERLNWEVKVAQGREQDEYDDEATVYVIGVRESDRCVFASWRVRPTLQPYMLRDTFPVLLGDKEAPCDQQVWEVSRFAVRRGTTVEDGAFCGFNDLTRKLFAHTLKWAIENGITKGVWVTTLSVERMARRLGYTLRRWSEPVKIGSTHAVVQEIIVDKTAVRLAYTELGLEHLLKAAA